MKKLLCLLCIAMVANANAQFWKQKEFILAAFHSETLVDKFPPFDINNTGDNARMQKMTDCYINLILTGMNEIASASIIDMNPVNDGSTAYLPSVLVPLQREFYLQLVKKYNLSVLLADPVMQRSCPTTWPLPSPCPNNSIPDLASYNVPIDQWFNSTPPSDPNVYGFSFKDEPNENEMKAIKVWSSQFSKYGKPTITNWSGYAQWGGVTPFANFLKDLDKFESSDPTSQVCSFDLYPFRLNSTGGKFFLNGYFFTLHEYRKRFPNRSLWATVHCASADLGSDNGIGDVVDATMPELQFMSFCPIAYGANGLNFFPFSGNYGGSFPGGNGLVEDNVKFGRVKIINHYIRDIVGPVVMNNKNIASLHKNALPSTPGTNPPVTSNIPLLYDSPGNPAFGGFTDEERLENYKGIVKDVSNDDILIGVFTNSNPPDNFNYVNKGDYFLWIVNKDTYNNTSGIDNLTVTLNGNYADNVWTAPSVMGYDASNNPVYSLISASYTAAASPQEFGTTTFVIPHLEPGEARMFKVIAKQLVSTFPAGAGANGAFWSITGNNVSSGNFLGTTNGQNLLFKTNNQVSGIVDYTKYNTSLGYESLKSVTTGSANTAFGSLALTTNISGNDNTAVGVLALKANTTGSYNTAVGKLSLYENTIGSSNVALGMYALNTNNTGSNNTATGFQTLFGNLSGSYNTGNGYQALANNTTGNFNTSYGTQTLYSNTTGNNNTAVGSYALGQNTTGSDNLALGQSALYANTTGSGSVAVGLAALTGNTSGSGNTAVGYQSLYTNVSGSNNTASGYASLYSNTSGYWNTALGFMSLYSNTQGQTNSASGYLSLFNNTTGNNNTATGYQALYGNTSSSGNTAHGYNSLKNSTGAGNTAVGFGSLYTVTSGSYNTAIGTNADISSGTYTNATAIGYNALATASNQVRIGDDYVTSIGGAVSWSTLSDGRAKRNIKANVPGLSFINKLKPVTYKLNTDVLSQARQKTNRQGIEDVTTGQAALQEQKDITYTGLIAQDVETVSKAINYSFSGVDVPKNENDFYGLRYADFVVPLIKAVQELSQQNDRKDSIINALSDKLNTIQAQIAELMSKVNEVKSTQEVCCTVSAEKTSASVSLSASYLEQNIPNPFNHTTIIGYYIAPAVVNAQITITDVLGRKIKIVELAGKGKGQVVLNAAELNSGYYYYTLVTDGKIVATKKMELHK